MEERKRYSDEELAEFKEIIEKKLELARIDYEELRQNMINSGNSGGSSSSFKIFEEGAHTLSKEASGRMAQRQMKFIRNLEAALMRIENKTYGVCRETGQLIPKERLRAVPHATLSIEAKENRK